MHSADRRSFLFRFGRYLCSVTGDSRLTDLIPVNWEVFRQDFFPAAPSTRGNDRIDIRLEEAYISSDGNPADGWKVQDSGASYQAVYVWNGKSIFALQTGSDHEIIVRVGKALDGYVRLGIHYGLLLALYRDCVGLHGVTLLCGDEIVILSAPSGTGKTTLAQMLVKYGDAIVINGDFALLTPAEDGVIFEPTPFCGTSGRCLNHRVRINRIVFLEQSPVNQWHTLRGREALKRFMDNAFIPTWDKDLQLITQENIVKCISVLQVNSFSFAPVREAAEMFFDQIGTNR